MSLINTKIKPFKNQAFKNGEFIEVTEKDTEGRWSVFFFYPADFTFVCPTELGDVADHYEELQKLGVDVYSVSTDTHFTHKAWHSSSETIAKIKYAMIGDPTGALTRNLDNDDIEYKYRRNGEKQLIKTGDIVDYLVKQIKG